MVNNKTYNNVIDTLCRLGQYHDQISTVCVGDSELIYNFQIFICDLVSEKKDWKTFQAKELTKLLDTKNNEQQVWNQTLEICTDFIGMLRHSSRQSLEGVNDINAPLYFTQDQFSIEPFQERFDNLLCGWTFTIGIKVMNDFSTCIIPVTDAGAGY